MVELSNNFRLSVSTENSMAEVIVGSASSEDKLPSLLRSSYQTALETAGYD
jgi:hypothetical protein